MTRKQNVKILIIQPLPGIGDVLWFLPHLKALMDKAPNASFSLLTKGSSRADEVLEGQVVLDNILWLDRSKIHKGVGGTWELVTLLREYNFDQVWILHKSPRYALVAKLAGIKKIYGYGFSYGRFLSTPPFLSKTERALHPIKQAEALLHHHGIMVDLMSQGLKVSPILRGDLEKRYSIQPEIPVVILGIGGSESYKKWPLPFFADLALSLFQRGCRVFVLGGMKEGEEALWIQNQVKKNAGEITPVFDLSLQESFSLLSLATFFVGNDTSMLNASAQLGIPTLGLFSKTPALTYRTNLHSLTTPAEGSMDQITVQTVQDTLFALMKK